jgi:hypothetical protein
VLVTWTRESRELGVPWCRRAGQCVGVNGSLLNRVHKLNRVVGGAVHPCASPGASERLQDWVFGGRAADTDRRSFEASRPHASRSQQHTARAEPLGERRPAASRDRQESAEQGHGISTRERRVRRTQEAETITGRVRREANPLADAPRMCATKSNAHQERSRRDKERKKCSKGLDNCGHIEGLWPHRPRHLYVLRARGRCCLHSTRRT